LAQVIVDFINACSFILARITIHNTFININFTVGSSIAWNASANIAVNLVKACTFLQTRVAVNSALVNIILAVGSRIARWTGAVVTVYTIFTLASI
jgi:hypothetical protein